MGSMMAAILAGGASTRFPVNKLFYRIGNKSLIAHVFERVAKFFGDDNVYFVASKENYAKLKALGFKNILLDDILAGPLSGIFIALKNLGDVFVFAGDLPCINRWLINTMYDIWSTGDYYAVVPGWRNGYLEPLHAIYSENLVSLIEENIRKRRLSITAFLKEIKNKYLLLLDDLPPLSRLSVYNVNTIDDVSCLEEGYKKNLEEPCMECLSIVQ